MNHPVASVAGLQQNELVQRAMQWHFNPSTGSPFWLRRAASLPFSPVDDVTCWADLALFPDVSAEWTQVPATDLIPQGCRNDSASSFETFDSGGTTGHPKRIVEATSRLEGVRWVNEVLARHGLPGEDGGDWLHIGPTGPHIVGRSVRLLAAMRRKLCFFLDFDPRWVKRCVRAGDTEGVVRYVDHVLDQAVDVLRSQPISVVFLTPPILEAICQRPATYELLAARAEAIIWAGTSMSAETLHVVTAELFPDAKVVGLYGNTLMGIAVQRPVDAADDELCVFQAFHPTCQIELVDPSDPKRHVAYGERGQVRFTLVSRDLFVPNCLERDTAIRVPPVTHFPWDGLAQVQTLAQDGPEVAVGVY